MPVAYVFIPLVTVNSQRIVIEFRPASLWSESHQGEFTSRRYLQQSDNLLNRSLLKYYWIVFACFFVVFIQFLFVSFVLFNRAFHIFFISFDFNFNFNSVFFLLVKIEAKGARYCEGVPVPFATALGRFRWPFIVRSP